MEKIDWMRSRMDRRRQSGAVGGGMASGRVREGSGEKAGEDEIKY